MLLISAEKRTNRYLENNPIQWPPPNVTVCPDDTPAEEWLTSLKAFLAQEGRSASFFIARLRRTAME
jgi:hypothetical protein